MKLCTLANAVKLKGILMFRIGFHSTKQVLKETFSPTAGFYFPVALLSDSPLEKS